MYYKTCFEALPVITALPDTPVPAESNGLTTPVILPPDFDLMYLFKINGKWVERM